MPKQKRVASNVVLAALMIMTVAITLVGNVVVNSSIPTDVPIGTAHVNVNVAQAPQRATGHVSLTVLPSFG